ncbi:hypothetical protein PCASD_07876 [Puccinia coronata f. sp. avenae]|uniref:Uncharacterized protein n=1 Tax=Puccinia coronata f. sp. avenae TaxID=200324 RepID=A0A2N5UQ65_9BASI|nr:hypothetical protein PCASD_07876 [Puccinia coronata f. sp. avenae]
MPGCGGRDARFDSSHRKSSGFLKAFGLRPCGLTARGPSRQLDGGTCQKVQPQCSHLGQQCYVEGFPHPSIYHCLDLGYETHCLAYLTSQHLKDP